MLIFVAFFVSAQKKKNIYFIGKKGEIVQSRDSADFIRVIQEPDSGSVNYVLGEFYTSGVKKRLGTVSKFPVLVLEGAVTEFYSNGKRKNVEHYANNKLIGEGYYYYENGNFMEHRSYLDKPIENTFYKTMQYADSTGKFLLDENGTGKVDNIALGSEEIFSRSYLNGLKNGEWIEYIEEEKITRKEVYENGKFVKGKRITDEGEIIEYNKYEELPSFTGGLEGFGKFLSRNLRYPTNAKQNNIQGRVFLQFVIEADGSLTEEKVVRGIGGGCDQEALRVIRLSPKWNPGIHRGKAVRVSYTVPIVFQIEKPSRKLELLPFQRQFDSY